MKTWNQYLEAISNQPANVQKITMQIEFDPKTKQMTLLTPGGGINRLEINNPKSWDVIVKAFMSRLSVFEEK